MPGKHPRPQSLPWSFSLISTAQHGVGLGWTPGMITIVTPKKQVVTTPCGYVIYLYILLFYPLDCS